MFYIRTAIINLKRYYQKSVINLLICIVVVLLLNLFIGSLDSNRRQLSALPEVMSIYAQISNLNGTQQTGLVIREERVEKLLQSEYITDPAITVVLSAGVGELSEDNPGAEANIDTVGITRPEAISGLKEDDITLEPDFSIDFLQSDAHFCIVEESFLEQNNWQLGQTVTLSIYYDYMDIYSRFVLHQLGVEDFLIVGSVKSSEGEYVPSIIIPYPWVRAAFTRLSLPSIANSASFYVKDPLQLNEFKEAMKNEIKLLEINPMADFAYEGNALAVNDETFILSASRIQDNIRLLKGFMPIIFIIVVFIGYITSYLLIQNRRGQYATMRSLGVSSRNCFFTLFAESVMVELTGGILGTVLSVLLTRQIGITQIYTFLLFMFCYICGTTAALYQLGKISVMKALAQKD
jgi:hypothetical protein